MTSKHCYGTVQTVHNYIDERGDLLYQVVRYRDPKRFRQRRPAKDPSKFIYNLGGIRKVPYRLPELLESQTVFVVEGEKDADTLAALGVAATCNSGGAGNFKAELARYFAGKEVVIVPDNDLAGRDHAADVAALLHPVATSVRVLSLPGLKGKGDVSDYIAAGGTVVELRKLLSAVPLYNPPPDTRRVRQAPALIRDAVHGDLEPNPVSKSAHAYDAGLPDLAWINRNIPVIAIARALNLHVEAQNAIHCWRDGHKDRNASVGVCERTNTVKCFKCNTKPTRPVDLVMDRLGFSSPAQAGRWIADLFPQVPCIPKRTGPSAEAHRIVRSGLDDPLSALVRSGTFGKLSAPTRCIATALAELATRTPADRTLEIEISYMGITRYSGVKSRSAISGAIRELEEIGWLIRHSGLVAPRQPIRQTNRYTIQPESDELTSLLQSDAEQTKAAVEAECQVRRRERIERQRRCAEVPVLPAPSVARRG